LFNQPKSTQQVAPQEQFIIYTDKTKKSLNFSTNDSEPKREYLIKKNNFCDRKKQIKSIFPLLACVFGAADAPKKQSFFRKKKKISNSMKKKQYLM